MFSQKIQTFCGFTKRIDGPHLLGKLLLGLCILCPCRLPGSLLGLSLPSGLTTVGQSKCCVGSLHGAGIYGG